MKYAIVESGGKQYRAVEGGTLEIDRMPVNIGESVKLEQVLLLADGENVIVGTPVIKDNPVWTKVVEHFKGEKVTIFNYSPKKRIRVKTGHRQNYTRLLVEQIGGSVLVKKEPVKVEKAVEVKAETVAPKAKAAKVEPKAETSTAKAKKSTAAAASKVKAASAKAETVSSAKETSSPKGKKPAAKTPAKGKTTSSPKETSSPKGKKPAASVSKKTTVTKAEPKKTSTKATPASSPKGTSSPKGKKPAAK